MQYLVGGESGGLRGPRDQVEEPLVGVGLAEQVDRLLGEELARQVAAVGLGQVIPEAREDDAVQGTTILSSVGPVGFAAERQGPVAQPVFKTGEAWQPHAG